MPAKLYPFIDIAVHPSVRAHFARGDAAVLFSPDMRNVLWSNGQGAALFGFSSIYDFLDAGANRADVTYRQMEATARQLKATGDQRGFMMRATSGFTRVALTASVEYILVRPGEEAILFTAPRAGKPLSIAACAEQMISGFDDPDTHMAVLGAEGEIVAASAGFDALGMSEQTRRLLVAAAARDGDWLVKRPVPTGRGQLPAAIGKLSDQPALHLLFAVETILGHMDPDIDTDETPQEATARPETALPETLPTPVPAIAAEDQDTIAPADDAGMWALLDAPSRPVDRPEDGGAAVADLASDESVAAEENAALDAVEPEQDVHSDDNDSDETEDAPAESVIEHVETAQPYAETDLVPDDTVPDTAKDDVQDAEFAEEGIADDTAPYVAIQDDTPALVPADVLPADAGFSFNPAQRAARFVWKIDADGQFSEISQEFAAAVGPHSADVVGKSFDSLAERYGFDQDNVVSELLKRRDTWSGKMILWPVQGTRLVAPVDLAALPTYSRNRTFDGFRGFGIVRVADAIEDPLARGLTIGQSIEPDTAVEERVEEPGADQDAQPLVDTLLQDDEIMPEAVDADLFSALIDPIEVDPVEAEPPQDPFHGERPALKLTVAPEPETSGNVVKIDDHRPQPAETLTRAEQAAFREIARRLGETVTPAPQDGASTDDAPEAVPEHVTPTDTALTDNDVPTEDDVDIQDVSSVPQTDEMTDSDEDETVTAQSPALVEDVQASDVAESDSGVEMDPGLAALAPATPEEAARLTPPLLDSLPVALLVHVGDELIHANSEFFKLTGYATLRLLEEEGGIDALFASEDELEREAPDGAMMLIRSDGQMRPVIARLQSIRWADRSVLMMALAAVPAEPTAVDPEPPAEEPAAAPDASEHLRVETEELRSILETATDGVVLVGADGDIRSLNRSASALFNYDDGEIRGKPFAMLFAHESQKAVIDYLAGLSGHGVASVLNDGREVIGREASGGFIPLFMTMGRLSSSNGYCAVIRDITQWKRTEEELRTAKRAAETANAHKTDFLARVSHEIRTPLNAIIGFSDMMASEHFGPIGNPRYVEYASDIGRSGRHVLDIVNDLLDISKIEAGEMDLEFSAVEINDAVSEAVSLVQPQANGQRVIIRTSLSGSVPSIVADSRSIKQIALNILANAIRFTPSGGQIVVSTAYEPNGSVILRIRDTGIGMTRSELEQAMKPFRQVSTSGRQRGDGTGLGLPLTKAMAEANRALFSINSAPNEGTLVEICFPSQRVLAD